ANVPPAGRPKTLSASMRVLSLAASIRGSAGATRGTTAATDKPWRKFLRVIRIPDSELLLLFGRCGARSDFLQRRQVEALAGTHEVVLLAVALLPLAGDRAAVVDRDLARAADLERLAADDDRGALVEADAEDVGVLRDDFLEIVLAVARQHVLVDGNARDQPEAFLVAGRHHEVVVLVRAADHVGREDRRPGRRSPGRPSEDPSRRARLFRQRQRARQEQLS